MQLGYSFCPNDTFIFYALTHGKITAPVVHEVLEDVETLNQWALLGQLELTKISYAAYARVREHYVALRAGGALGRGVGPLLLLNGALTGMGLEQWLNTGNPIKRIASPGALTTAQLLLTLALPLGSFAVVPMRYDQIMPALAGGQVDAGLVIHESRFTYQNHGLYKLLDLGQWWEQETKLPIPLGAILARRDLGPEMLQQLNHAVRQSLEYAYAHPSEPKAYIKQHALEQDEAVMQAHIDLYVNQYSLDVGETGMQAVAELFRRAEQRGLLPHSDLPLFVELE
jgi:1,4-dihydroxy-6-naphthoate synthase